MRLHVCLNQCVARGMLALLLVAPMAVSGCSTPTETPPTTAIDNQASVSSNDPQIISDFSSSANDSYNFETTSLTRTETFQGVSFSVDPMWDQTQNEDDFISYKIATGDAMESFWLHVEPFLHDETEDLDSLRHYGIVTDAGNPVSTPVKDINGVSIYRVTWQSSLIRQDFLIGYDKTTGHGFVMTFYYNIPKYGADDAPRTKSNCNTMTKLFQSLSYDPSQTTEDHYDNYQEELKRSREDNATTQEDTGSNNTADTGAANPTKDYSTIDEENAMTAFEKEGERRYPYGFECHWITDWKTREQLPDGSWSYKVGVTITNETGVSRETTAEATISGTNESPAIDNFYVY